jgi:CRP/FNR family cyclic AMP-dependent transcriptional regulator
MKMQMQSLEPILAAHPFFKDLGKPYLELLTGCASNVRFEAGEYILRQGQEANTFYIIRHGNVALEILTPGRGPITVETIGEGDVLGWSWLFPPYKWHFDARAVDLTRAIALDGACLREKCEADHNLGFELLKRFAEIMTRRLQATRLQLLDVYNVRP